MDDIAHVVILPATGPVRLVRVTGGIDHVLSIITAAISSRDERDEDAAGDVVAELWAEHVAAGGEVWTFRVVRRGTIYAIGRA